MPILDPLLQLASIAAFNPQVAVGTAVYLLPLRHPTTVAKQVATLDRLTGGRFIFGVGVGGEFPIEYEACGVPLRERGARLSEAIPILKGLWSGQAFASEGKFYPFSEVTMRPTPVQAGGPPIWCGGRSPAALARIGRMGDGWVSYVVTPDQYRAGLDSIAAEADRARRKVERFGTAHLLFAWIDDDHDRALDAATEHLSMRYAMDFRKAAQRYAALGSPADVAAKIAEFRAAGTRHFILDMTGPAEERDAQLARFAAEVRPLL
jgi:probable F420-dependent oxidoreductase